MKLLSLAAVGLSVCGPAQALDTAGTQATRLIAAATLAELPCRGLGYQVDVQEAVLDVLAMGLGATEVPGGLIIEATAGERTERERLGLSAWCEASSRRFPRYVKRP